MALTILLCPADTVLLYAFTSFLVWFVSLIVYRRFFHPLAKVPGPFLPAVTRLYAWYFNVPKEGRFYKEIERLHSIYGPVVRIAPNEIHLSDPENYDKIYTVNSKFYKDPLFYGALGIDAAAFATIPNDLHRRRRAALSPFFSRRTVLEQEDIVHAKVEKLFGRVKEELDDAQPIDLGAGFRAISVDVITDYGFDKCFDCLDSPDLGAWFSDMVRGSGPMFWTFQQFPLLQKLLQKLPYSIAHRLDKSLKDFLDCQIRTREQVLDVKKKIAEGEKPKRTTIFHQLLDPNATEGHVVPSVNDLADEAFAICTAAADTTGNAMTVAAFHVISNYEINDKLTEELKEAFPDENGELSFAALEKLPYLTAVIKEGQRLSYGVISRLPRITPEGGATFNGYYVPAGTTVSMSSYLMHRDPTAFPEPSVFDPSRWLDPDPSVVRMREKCLVPFSRGNRMCLGQNLAQCEMYVTLGTLFRRWDDLEPYAVSRDDIDDYEDWFSAFPKKKARRFRVTTEGSLGAYF